MFRFSINIPKIGGRRTKEAMTEDLVPLHSQSRGYTKSKPQLRLSMPPRQQQLIIVDPPQAAPTHNRFSFINDAPRHRYAEIEEEPEIVQIAPGRPASYCGGYRMQEYIESLPERRYITDNYDEDDYYDGDQTPIATRRLIVEAPRSSRSRSRGSVASSRRSVRYYDEDDDNRTPTATRKLIVEAPRSSRSRSRNSVASSSRSASVRSARSVSTAASTSTTRSAASTRSSTASTVSDASTASRSSRSSSVSTAPSSVRSSSTSSYHRYRPSEDDLISVKSYGSQASSNRSLSEKTQKKLKGILKVAEYTSGRSRRYSKLR